MAALDRRSPSRVAEALSRTRRQGMLLEGIVSLSFAAAFVALAHRWGAGFSAWFLLVTGAGLFVLAGSILSRRWTPLRSARVLEREDPRLEQGLLAWATAPESALTAELERWLMARPLRARQTSLRTLALLAALTAGLSIAWSFRAPAPIVLPSVVTRAISLGKAKPPASGFKLEIRVAPPAYTRLPAGPAALSPQGTLDVIAGSRVTLRLSPESDARTELIWSLPGTEPERFVLSKEGLVRSFEIRSDLAIRIAILAKEREPFTRLLLFRARADRPPDVEIVSPAEDRTLHAAPPPFVVEALAQDDFGLASGTLRYTLAHGRGEGMTFKNGILPSTSRGTGGNGLRLASRLDPKALGFGLGDTLVFWAEAADRNDVTGPGLTRSSPRVLRWEDATAALDILQSASLALAREAPLSERELLKRTRRLVAAGLSPAARRDRALDLAEQQRGIRLRFAVFTREESGDSAAAMDVETEETNPLGPKKQERLLAMAVDAMWRAERALTTGEPRNAVTPEQDAIRMLDDAFGLERISLTALAAPSASVDLAKRLTGDAKGLRPAPDALAQDPEESAGRVELRSLARFLDEAALDGPLGARRLGDRVFSSRPVPGFEPSIEAATLYAAKDDAELRQRARALSLRLLTLLEGPPALALPASTREGAVTRLLEGVAPRRSPR